MTENTIHGKMAQAIAEIQSADWTPDGQFSIEDKKSAKDVKISYVTLRKIKHTIAPILARHGLIVIYEYDEPKWLPPVSQLKPSHVLIRLTAYVYDDKGQCARFVEYGEGADRGEKAVSFQRAYALRSFYQDAFCISDYLEPEEVESERVYVRQSDAVPVLMQKAVSEEKPQEAPAPAVQGKIPPKDVSEPAQPVKKPLSPIHKRAIENMRVAILKKVEKGEVTEDDAKLTLDALDGIEDADMFAQFLQVKGDFNL